MFNVKSKIELEDVVYSIRIREEYVAKQINEAKLKNQKELIDTLQYELRRLQLLRGRAEGDGDIYQDERRMLAFSDPNSGTD